MIFISTELDVFGRQYTSIIAFEFYYLFRLCIWDSPNRSDQADYTADPKAMFMVTFCNALVENAKHINTVENY